MSPLLDTHAWIWWLQGDEGLTSRERASLETMTIWSGPSNSTDFATIWLRLRRSVPLW
jgi:hypothetical protein